MNIKIIVPDLSSNIKHLSTKISTKNSLLVIKNTTRILGYEVDFYCRNIIKCTEFKKLHKQYILCCYTKSPIRQIQLHTIDGYITL